MNPKGEIRGGRENKQNWEQILQQGKQVYFESYTVLSNIDQMNREKKKRKRAKPYQTMHGRLRVMETNITKYL